MHHVSFFTHRASVRIGENVRESVGHVLVAEGQFLSRRAKLVLCGTVLSHLSHLVLHHATLLLSVPPCPENALAQMEVKIRMSRSSCASLSEDTPYLQLSMSVDDMFDPVSTKQAVAPLVLLHCLCFSRGITLQVSAEATRLLQFFPRESWCKRLHY